MKFEDILDALAFLASVRKARSSSAVYFNFEEEPWLIPKILKQLLMNIGE